MLIYEQVPKAIRQQLRTLLACLKRYNATMCGGPVLDDVQQWKRFLRHNSVTQTEEFYPENYMEPLRGKLEFQDAMVHTQLFVSFIDRLRREQRILDQVRYELSLVSRAFLLVNVCLYDRLSTNGIVCFTFISPLINNFDSL